MGNDPLTSMMAMIAMIEPGYRMIDGSLLKQLYLAAGQPALAATVDPGFRLIDATLLHDLAAQVGAHIVRPIFGEAFQERGPRLIDGWEWKELAQRAQVPPGPGIWGGTDVWDGGQNWI